MIVSELIDSTIRQKGWAKRTPLRYIKFKTFENINI